MAGEATGAFEEHMRPLLKRAEESVRESGNSPHGIASRVIGLKVFSNKFIFKTLEFTTVDLPDTFEDVRDRAFIAILAATGLRYNAVLTMRSQDYDRVTGEFKVHEKGDEDRPALVDGRARRFLNTRDRPNEGIG